MANEWNVGDRVGAVMDMTETLVRLFGYGTYQGEVIPPEGITLKGIPMKAPNPKIKLDSGEIVWGCECWWGSEDEVKEAINKREVLDVKIEDKRKEIQKATATTPQPAQSGHMKHGEPGSKKVETKKESVGK